MKLTLKLEHGESETRVETEILPDDLLLDIETLNERVLIPMMAVLKRRAEKPNGRT